VVRTFRAKVRVRPRNETLHHGEAFVCRLRRVTWGAQEDRFDVFVGIVFNDDLSVGNSWEIRREALSNLPSPLARSIAS
jgi:hypothetical protein